MPGPDDPAAAVGAVGPGEHEVELDRAQRGGQHEHRGEGARALQGIVDDQDRPCGTHREPLAQRVLRAGRTHRDERDVPAGGLGELERRFEGVFVVAVEHRGRGGAVEPAVRQQPLLAGGVRDRLDEHDDPHGRDASLLARRDAFPLGGAECTHPMVPGRHSVRCGAGWRV